MYIYSEMSNEAELTEQKKDAEMNNEQRDQMIEEQYNQFMKDVLDENYDGDFSEYGFEQPTPKVELTFTDISEEITFITETPAPVPAPQPRRVFAESRPRFSKAQEGYSQKLARQIRDILFNQFNEDYSAHYFHKNFTIDQKLEMLDELKAGRNFDVK